MNIGELLQYRQHVYTPMLQQKGRGKKGKGWERLRKKRSGKEKENEGQNREGKGKGKEREEKGRKRREENGVKGIGRKRDGNGGEGRKGKGKRKKGKGMGRKGRRFYFDQHDYIVVCSGTKTLKDGPKPRFITKFSTLWGSCTFANFPIRFKFGIRKWFSGVPDHAISSLIRVEKPPKTAKRPRHSCTSKTPNKCLINLINLINSVAKY